LFKEGDKVDVRGRTIGKGFQGAVKRYGFSRGLMTHGSKSHRQHGSIGSGTNPGRIYPGKRMHGHMGNEMVTTKGLTVVSVEDDCIIVKGNVPGKKGALCKVTPNKKVGSGPLARYEECQALVKESSAMWGYEVTVGAGLPLVNVLKKDLLQTGDTVHKIEGIFSGTLSYLFNTFKPGMKFSEVIAKANAEGFTEPDPRDDLGGLDVARKVCILARECGMKVELSDIPIKSLVPDALKDWKPAAGENMRDAFAREMAKFDDEKTALMAGADAKGMVLRFVGVVDVENKKCEVKLDMYPKTHSFAGTQWADNIVAFHTERYVPQPLVVQGPGAGAAVTAAGLYAECIKIIDRVH